MVGSDIVAIALVSIFAVGFVYFSFVLPAKQKKNNEGKEVTLKSETVEDNSYSTEEDENSMRKKKSQTAGSKQNRKIMK